MNDIQKEISYHLKWAASGYAKSGMAHMFGSNGFVQNTQAAFGNLAIAIELYLKSFIAKQSLILLYKNLPKELQCALLSPTMMPESFRSGIYEIEIKSSIYRQIELDEAISTFNVFFPEFKKKFNSYLKNLCRHRNVSVHAVYPDYLEYECQRIAYLFLNLVKQIEKSEIDFKYHYHWCNDEKITNFLKQFNEKLISIVHEKIEQAKKKAKNIDEKYHLEPEEWDWYPCQCPVCGSDGYFTGETELDSDSHAESWSDVGLLFLPESFNCEECGLHLEDYDEMMIAGMDTDKIDRSDEMNKWVEDFRDDDYY